MVQLSATKKAMEGDAMKNDAPELVMPEGKPVEIMLTESLEEYGAEYQKGVVVIAYQDEEGTVALPDTKDVGEKPVAVEPGEYKIVESLNETGDETDDEVESGNEVNEANEDTSEPDREPDRNHNSSAETDHQDAVANVSASVASCAIRWSKLQEETKEAKKDFDNRVEQLRGIVSRGPERMPLFDQQTESNQPEQDDTEGNGSDNANSDANPDAWRDVAISELILSIPIITKLEDNGIETIGDLEDTRAEISIGKEKWPKGIGPAKVTLIEDAVINWLSENRDQDALQEAQNVSEENDEQSNEENIQEDNEESNDNEKEKAAIG